MGKIQTWPLSMLIRARCLLLLMLKKTYEYIEPGAKDHNIRISQPAIVLDERQCSLQIIFCPVGKQPQLAIIFHGTGTILSLDQQLLGTLMFTFYFKKISEWIPKCWTETGLKKFIKKALIQRCSGKHLCQILFFKSCRPDATNFIKEDALAQVLSCEFCETLKNTYFYRTTLVATFFITNEKFEIYSTGELFYWPT